MAGGTTDYRRLTAAAKQARHRESMREPAIVCPACETQLAVADAMRHAAACPGPREPHPLSKWLRWKEVHRLGVAKATLSRWVVTRKVRFKVEEGHRLFLERDVKKQLIGRSGSESGTRGEAQ